MTAAVALPRPGAEASGWPAHLGALALAAGAILLLHARDAAGMASIWWNSSTFGHCLLIPPIIAWLVWQRRAELARIAPAAWAPGLLLVGLGASAWLAGEAGSAAVARHLGLVLMLQGAAIACLGKAVARGLAFPFFFAFFLVPAGEALVPPMQRLTAEIAMALLAFSAIPAYLDGVFIATSAALFEVAEACAGVKFLIAMLALGALVANLCFRSWPRRIAFIAAAIVVPVLANGVRAWGTILVAHEWGVEFAIGFDHVVYGGVFFALVIAVLLAAAWPFFDRKPDQPWFDPEALQPAGAKPGPARRLRNVASAAAALAAAPLLWAAAAASTELPAPPDLSLPEVAGWERLRGPAAGRPWQPDYPGADLVRIGRYRDGRGREVDLAIVLFAQGEGSSGRSAGPGWAWSGRAAPPPGGKAERIVSHGTSREVVTFYRVGDSLTGSEAGVKLATMKARLIGGPPRAVAVLVSAEAPGAGMSPRPAIDSFLAGLGPVEALADRAAGR